MKAVKKEVLENGTILITVEKTFFFGLFKRLTIYSSNRVLVGRFRVWLIEPDKIMVPDYLSFQLDEWNESI